MKKILLALCLSAAFCAPAFAAKNALVLQTDFGTSDGAVSAMHGVAYGVDPNLTVADLTHNIPDYDIWVGGYRLFQTANYWPQGTVFVSVIDPGVGTTRKSVVLKTKEGRYFIGPDNGQFTLIAERDGVAELREIDEKVNRRAGSGESYTFHGRDVYAYVGARLASGTISYEQVGPSLPVESVIKIPYQKAALSDGKLRGIIPVLDIKYGNVWTNVPKALFDQLGVKEHEPVQVRFFHNKKLVNTVVAPYEHTFGGVAKGKPLVYLNSLLDVAVALNQGSYAEKNKIDSGVDWEVEISKAKK
ncbi:S-adenosyl-l-methionine hydroxide adenosyltransferase family protein [Duganella dendranthematis]|uniref:S-adenosyl-l-methionine hydroxide adenosyltransferase family protein n=1 Tax=Duganella dendranthematis TaxID=2728021 RepID=A0ABX6MB25_9BURK|nr:S-adenosyl-l-methionine hydroxide adenosyltransferase family protein [Duganella dendranthematis]QJD91107.1 S-adenosyl-l-methionine hydroxide adenosyltransferase family protein [Duganella dendranthematis]